MDHPIAPALDTDSPAPAATSPTAAVIPLPIHVVARDAEGHPVPVRRGPGRPRRVRPAPTADEAAYDEATRAAREAHVEADAVVQAAQLHDRSAELAWAVLRGIARECASLDWEIERNPSSREAERARSRRIDGLLAMARLRVEIAKIEAGEVTPRRLEQLKGLLVREILAVLRETIGPDLADEFEARLRQAWAVVGVANTR